MPKVVGFEAYETIGIGLPNVYRCHQCERLVHCFYPHESRICYECAKREPRYEKLQAKAEG
jgi:hypothetical protein